MKTANNRLVIRYTLPFIAVCSIGWFGGMFVHWALFALATLIALVYLMVNQVVLTDDIATCEYLIEGKFTPRTRQRNQDTARLITTSAIAAVLGLLTVVKDDWSVYSLIVLLIAGYLFVRQALLLDELEILEIKLYGVDDE